MLCVLSAAAAPYRLRWVAHLPALCAGLCLAALLSGRLPAYELAKLQEMEKTNDALAKDPDVAKKLPCPKVGEVTVDIPSYFDSKYHYSVYLPKAYDPKVKWPVIFCNSPGGNAKNYCNAYKDFADEFGWILVGNTECSNTVAGAGQYENNLSTILDVTNRFNVHLPMCIFLGFSGGARVGETWCFGPVFDWPMGTIQMGAGDGQYPPSAKKNCQVYIIVGDTDMNNSDCKGFYKKCQAAGHKTVLVEYKAGHQDAPPEMVRTAIQWQTETFLKTHPDKSETTLRLRKVWVDKFIQAAKDSEAAGDKVATYVLYRTAVEEGNSMPVGADVKKTLADIQNKTMKELAKDDGVKKEIQANGEYTRMLAWAKGLPATKNGLLYAPQQFETIAKKFPDQPSGKLAAKTAQDYKDQIAALK